MYSFTHLWYRMKKANICCCCMSIICRGRMAKAKQNAWFGFMFITTQYAPEMKSDQLCWFWPVYVFWQCDPNIVSHFSALLVVLSTFQKFLGCLIFGLGCSVTWAIIINKSLLKHNPLIMTICKKKCWLLIYKGYQNKRCWQA